MKSDEWIEMVTPSGNKYLQRVAPFTGGDTVTVGTSGEAAMRRLYNVIMANRHTEEVREEFVFATSLDEAKMKMLIRQQVPEKNISWWVLSAFVVCEVPLMEDK
jgi:hypothetical protein